MIPQATSKPKRPIYMPRYPLTTVSLRTALLFSQLMALLWWCIALYLRSLNNIPVWIDQELNLSQTLSHFFDPYALPGFVNPPWVVVLLLPFSLIPLPVSTLIQIGLLFGLLTAVIYKFGGNFKTVLLALVSFVALDAAIEINIDWIVLLGLLLPAAWSGPFLVVKPQDALGVVLSFRRRDVIRTGILTLSLFLLSLVIWREWPLTMWQAVRHSIVGRSYNIAPLILLPWPVSLAIGILIAWHAFKRRDPVLSILAWFFITPYVALYSLLLPFGLFAIRSPRIALVISVAMWIIYGFFVVLALLNFR